MDSPSDWIHIGLDSGGNPRQFAAKRKRVEKRRSGKILRLVRDGRNKNRCPGKHRFRKGGRMKKRFIRSSAPKRRRGNGGDGIRLDGRRLPATSAQMSFLPLAVIGASPSLRQGYDIRPTLGELKAKKILFLYRTGGKRELNRGQRDAPVYIPAYFSRRCWTFSRRVETSDSGPVTVTRSQFSMAKRSISYSGTRTVQLYRPSFSFPKVMPFP